MTIDHSKDGITEVEMEELRSFVKNLQEKKKLRIAFKMKHMKKRQLGEDEEDVKGGTYDEGKGYLRTN